ncbi:MAG: helix-turn-helix domain-containing protein [Pseudonocardiaceae bacterium]
MRPTVRSRRLGAQLRGYREEAHLDQTRVAGTIGIKQAQMSSIENGRTKISAEKLATLVEALRIPAEVAARMEDLRARAHIPGWWQDYGDILSEPIQALAEYADEERAAAEEESHTATASTVFSVRLQPAVYEALKIAASRAHLTPSALIRQWVTERVEATDNETDLATAVATLRRDVERVASLVRPA